MNQKYDNYAYQMPVYYSNNNDERLAGGFVFPFLLGGVTGAALAPSFWNNGYGNNNRPGYVFIPGPYQGPYPGAYPGYYPRPYYRNK